MNISIAVHGGASDSSSFLKQNMKQYEAGLQDAAHRGYELLKKGSSAITAVEEAIKLLEDNPLFNAGRGSALNCKGEVEMDASIMDGETLKAGAISIVRNIKNPISLARFIMENTEHVFISGEETLNLAKKGKLLLKPDAYFITDHQYELFEKHGTVGAVALDKKGNIAAGTSTGGITNSMPGRVGDSCVIGAGCYANNQSCAVSGTGEGEYLITGVIAHTIAMMTESNTNLQDVCDQVIQVRNKQVKKDIGVIAVNPKGELGISFNTEIMKRAWIGCDGILHVKID